MYRVVFTPPDTSGLPAELRPLVERCLAKDPDQRPGTDQLLAELKPVTLGAGWLPAPVTQALSSYPPAEPGPAAPTAADNLPTVPVTELVTAAGTMAPGGRAGRWPGRSRLGLAGAAVAVALAVAYLIVAMTARLPPFGKPSLPPSSPGPVTTAPASTRPRPSSAVTSPTTPPAGGDRAAGGQRRDRQPIRHATSRIVM